ncbi:hypothetical protein EMIT0111MI5_70054 [Burkholderia sp. IT-111MI5]
MTSPCPTRDLPLLSKRTWAQIRVALPVDCDINMSNTSLARHRCTNFAHSFMDKFQFNENVCAALYRNIRRLHRHSIVDTRQGGCTNFQ